MKQYLMIAFMSVVAALVVTIYGCASDDKKTDASLVERDTRAVYEVNCYMGHITGISVLTDGAGRFNIEIGKYECDESDRT